MPLAEYRRKRDFSRTQEPRGRQAKKGKKAGLLFVVQKHAATRLHYDFRLQIGDVLKSWAVPKGPSLDPGVKRLAIHVEDHPLEYGSFEGTIPEGEYGGGTVMVWDTGTWEELPDPSKGYSTGKLHFVLHGKKLRGEWILVKSSGRRAMQGGKEAWLLFKAKDEYALKSGEPDIVDTEPLSVLSGRDLDEIAQNKRRKVWHSNKPARNDRKSSDAAERKTAVRRQRERRSARQSSADISGARKVAMPTKIVPQLASLVKEVPESDQWFNEIKFDGYRMICRLDRREARFFSRNQLDWTARLPHLVKAVQGLGLGQAILDGEVVALDDERASSFQSLQNAFRSSGNAKLLYYLFDLLYLDGYDLRGCTLEDRKQVLSELLGAARGPLRYSDHVEGHGGQFLKEACKMHLEGIICKRRDMPYRAGRSAEWIKVKCLHREEFVIGGYTPPEGSRRGFGALAVGYYDNRHKLIYAGRVGTGFSDKLLVELSGRLKDLQQDDSPFANLKGRAGLARGVHWVTPKLVAQVEFGQWTEDNYLRHPAFLGLREDKPADEVMLEKPLPLKEVEKAAPKKSARQAKSAGARKNGRATKARPAALARVEIPASIRLTNPDKVLYPEDGITKADLAGYYASIADWVLPHMVDRPLVLVRCPEGISKQCFYQKHAAKGTPQALRQIPIVEKHKTMQFVVVDDLEGLLSLAQMGVLEIHLWGAKTDKIEMPDRLVFDLDPDTEVPWKRVIDSAQQVRDFLAELGLKSFLKTTGGKGLHLVVPVQRKHDWDETKAACQTIAQAIVRADPDRYTANMSKAARPGKIYLDYLRNGRGATSVAAYSTRARAGAAVSTPLSWEELSKTHSADQFNLHNLPERLAKLKDDPWRDLAATRQSLSLSVIKKLSV